MVSKGYVVRLSQNKIPVSLLPLKVSLAILVVDSQVLETREWAVILLSILESKWLCLLHAKSSRGRR